MFSTESQPTLFGSGGSFLTARITLGVSGSQEWDPAVMFLTVISFGAMSDERSPQYLGVSRVHRNDVA
ncbi:hypothetical protein TNCV_4507201 [Trichonephila clavipes]|nr:hypothetical protein TNCV_4507201 [Trichonephila clavipes]